MSIKGSLKAPRTDRRRLDACQLRTVDLRSPFAIDPRGDDGNLLFPPPDLEQTQHRTVMRTD